MKQTISAMIFTLILVMAPMSSQAAKPLIKVMEWPIYPQTMFLKGGVNAVATGSTLMFWALGDTVSIIDKATLTQRSALVIRTGSAIQDLLYDEANERLFIAAGYDPDDQSGGVQIVDVSDPDNPVVTVIFDQAPDNPGSYIDFTDNKETPVEQPHIDARGLGLYDGILFVADDKFGLRVIDVTTDPAHPVEKPLTTQTDERISGYKQPNIVGSYDATGGYVGLTLYPFGGKVYAFVLDFYSGIKVFDVSEPAVIDEPVLKPTLSQIWYASFSLISDIFVTETGGRLSAYVAGTNAQGDKSVISRMDIDVSTPMTITNFGIYESEDEARSVCVSGNYAYLTCGSAGLKIVDISGIPTPGQVLDYPLLGTYDTGVDGAYHVFLEGSNLYLASAESGLKTLQTMFIQGGVRPVTTGSTLIFWALGDTISIIDKATLTQRSSLVIQTGTAIQDLLYDEANERLYIAAGYDPDDQSGGVQIVDVSDPDNPAVTVIFDKAPGNPGSYIDNTETPVDQPHIDARGLGFHNGNLFVADYNFGLRVIDVTTDPAHPVEKPLTTQTDERISGYKQAIIVDSYDDTGGYVGLTVYPFGGRVYAFVHDVYYSGIKVFDVTDPAVIGEPVLSPTLSRISDFFVTETGGRLSAYVNGTNEQGDKSVISRLDIDVGGPMTITNFGNYESEDDAHSVSVSGNYAYLACGSSGIKIVDISAIPTPGQELDYPLEGTYDTGTDGAYHFFLEGALLYLASAESGLKTLNVADPIAPVPDFSNPSIPDLAFPLSVDDVCFAGNHTYLLDRSRGLRIIQNQSPNYLVLESFHELSGISTDLAVSEQYAYVAQNSGTVRVISINDPSQPADAGAIALADPRGLFIDGNTLYVAAGAEGVHRVDITDPLHPVILSALPAAGEALSVHVHGDRAYVAEGLDGLSMFDLSEPSSPVLLATVAANDARHVAILEQNASLFALIADGASGFMIQDITDPSNPLPSPIRVDTLDGGAPFSALSVAVLDDSVFVGLGIDGLLALDLTDPTAPEQTAHKTTPTSAGDIVLRLYERSIYLVVAEGAAGLQIYNEYASSGYDDPPNLVPRGPDAGCFIDTVKHHETKGITRILSRIVSLMSFWSPGL